MSTKRELSMHELAIIEEYKRGEITVSSLAVKHGLTENQCRRLIYKRSVIGRTKKHLISASFVADVRREYLYRGFTLKALAEKHGLPLSKIRYIVFRQPGCSIQGRATYRLTAQEKQELVSRRLAGVSTVVLMRDYGVSRRRVQFLVNRYREASNGVV